MRAKNEFKFLAEAYNTKLILERVVDGKLMCPEACCGAPVVECTCGEDCPHCNCFMIHKAMKEKGFTNKLLKEGIVPEDERDEPIRNRELPAGHYDTHVRLQRGGRWNAHTVNVRKTDKELIQKFLDQGFRIVKPFDEDNEEIDIGTMVTWNQDGPMKGEVVDVDVEQGFAVVETGLGHMRVGPSEKWVVELGELTKAVRRKPRSTQTRFPETRPGRPGFRPAEDNKENTHKESYTSNYLSEQKSSDKRNIKPRTENQSFKERYKPKTHWQLEELRRMGL